MRNRLGFDRLLLRHIAGGELTHAGDEPNPRVGVFEEFSGTAMVQGGKLQSVSVEIQTGSLKTQNSSPCRASRHKPISFQVGGVSLLGLSMPGKLGVGV